MIKKCKRTHWNDREETSLIRLDRNENSDQYLPEVVGVAFLDNLDPKCVISYPNLKKAYQYSEKLLNISTDNFLLLNGSEQALQYILRVHRQELDSIVFPNPTFGMVKVYSELFDYNTTSINYKYNNVYDEEEPGPKKFTLDYNDLLRASRSWGGKSDIVYVASPDNFTGSSICEEYIKALCKEYKLVIIDQAYVCFDKNSIDIEKLITEYSNLYVIRSFSKCYFGAGLRIGCVISNKDNIETLSSYKPMYEINSIACEFIEWVYNNPNVHERSLRFLMDGKQFLSTKLNTIDDCNGNFVVVEYTDELYDKLSKHFKVRLFQLNEFDKFIRITLADRETLACIGL